MSSQEKTQLWLNKSTGNEAKSIHERTIIEPKNPIRESSSALGAIKKKIAETIKKSPLKKLNKKKPGRLNPDELSSNVSINPSWDAATLMEERRYLRPRKRIDYKEWIRGSNKYKKPFKEDINLKNQD